MSEIGFGAWAIGGSWGNVDDTQAKAALHATLDAGVTFLDTADVYGDGHSERLIRDVLAERGGAKPVVATKAGRRLDPHVASSYTIENIEGFIDRSLTNLGTDCLDLVQLHCPPTEVLYTPELFGGLDELITKGKLKHYGVSVETVEQGLKAIEYPGVVSVQIIYNMFRQRPAELFFRQAQKRDVAIIVRVPLASGMLSGKMTAQTHFEADDHRAFNRHGEAFDVGETFSGVPYDVALEAVEAIRPLVSDDASMAQFALHWILMDDAVSVVIPGARTPEQARANAAASALPALSDDVMQAARAIYQERIAAHVHQRW